MSNAPSPDDRITLSQAVAVLSVSGDHVAARQTVKSRARRGLIGAWAESYEMVAPKDYDQLVDAAHASALAQAEGDQLRAAIMMQGWRPADDVHWEVIRERDVCMPKKFWVTITERDAAWTTNSFLGRLADFDGYEQNWVGIYLRRSEVDAFPRAAVGISPMSDTSQAEPAIVASGTVAPAMPSQAELEAWARDFHSRQRAAGGSIDWGRTGQGDLERSFPGRTFKRTDALDLAKQLGLTRGYSR